MRDIIVQTIPKTQTEEIRVSLTEDYETRVKTLMNLINIRIWADKNGVEGRVPTKGLSVQVKFLPAIIQGLREAELQARHLGWLP